MSYYLVGDLLDWTGEETVRVVKLTEPELRFLKYVLITHQELWKEKDGHLEPIDSETETVLNKILYILGEIPELEWGTPCLPATQE